MVFLFDTIPFLQRDFKRIRERSGKSIVDIAEVVHEEWGIKQRSAAQLIFFMENNPAELESLDWISSDLEQKRYSRIGDYVHHIGATPQEKVQIYRCLKLIQPRFEYVQSNEG
jgi:hypothetical protein